MTITTKFNLGDAVFVQARGMPKLYLRGEVVAICVNADRRLGRKSGTIYTVRFRKNRAGLRLAGYSERQVHDTANAAVLEAQATIARDQRSVARYHRQLDRWRRQSV